MAGLLTSPGTGLLEATELQWLSDSVPLWITQLRAQFRPLTGFPIKPAWRNVRTGYHNPDAKLGIFREICHPVRPRALLGRFRLAVDMVCQEEQKNQTWNKFFQTWHTYSAIFTVKNSIFA